MSSKRNVWSALKPLSLFSNCFYLLMFSMKDDKVIVSKIKVLLSFVCAVVCCGVKCRRLYLVDSKDYEKFIINLTGYLFVGFCMASHLNFQVHAKRITHVWNEILAFGDFLNERTFYAKAFRIGCLKLGVCNGLFMLYLTFYYHFYFEDFHGGSFFLEALVDYLMLMHFCGVISLFTSGLLFGWKLISVANEELEKLREIEKYKEYQRWNVLKFDEMKKIKELRGQMKLIRQEDLTLMINVYEGVCKAFDELNDCFGISLTASCINTVMEMTLACFFMTKHGLSVVKMFSLWFTYCFIIELTLVSSCEKFVKETKKTGYIVNLLVTDSSSHTLKDSVQRFSQHLLHRQVKFTACRLFDLNYQFLFSVFSTIITYLVIVIQFDKNLLESGVLKKISGGN